MHFETHGGDHADPLYSVKTLATSSSTQHLVRQLKQTDTKYFDWTFALALDNRAKRERCNATRVFNKLFGKTNAITQKHVGLCWPH